MKINDHIAHRNVCTLPVPVRDQLGVITTATCPVCDTEFILLNGFIEIEPEAGAGPDRWVVRKSWDEYLAHRFPRDERTGMHWDRGLQGLSNKYLPPLTGDHLLNLSAEDRAVIAGAKLEAPDNPTE